MTHKIIKVNMKGRISATNKTFVYENNTYKGANFKLTLTAN